MNTFDKMGSGRESHCVRRPQNVARILSLKT